MATSQQEQLTRFFEIINNSKLNTELVELLQATSNSYFFEIQKGTDDAQAIRLPAARGFLGNYDADTNDPSLADGTGIDGDHYIISVAGTRDFGSGAITFAEDDFVKYISGIWRKMILVTETAQLINNSSDGVDNNHFASQIEIGGQTFLLMKRTQVVADRNTLEVNDVVIGYDDLGNFLMAKYKGGTVTLFQDDSVWEKFGGF